MIRCSCTAWNLATNGLKQCGAQYGIFAQTDIVIQFCHIISLILPIYWAYCQLLYEDLPQIYIAWGEKKPEIYRDIIVLHTGLKSEEAVSSRIDLKSSLREIMIQKI